jgi:3-deoxy-7-phosphoheptulonate synthase
VVNQVRNGNRSIVGVMIESFLEAGNQPIPADLSELRYGCSVTDACIGWDTTEALLRETADTLRAVVAARAEQVEMPAL